ncbi:hypothetical protein H6S82_14940 [Planktothrix sp. FACHB-1355]|uniref:Uncharacterized protein n=1 Tax=Aerosakkonema funiforme FACHB-1375 TaxID=2949571 RepID=A0A926VFV4_9CYAN|nr:hypothetical protein [Aerosakkonema funiforme]MBD2183031.1 hypothetical protein [Aerosakkonema funiforme FACHB-1375]MBD3560141.1 hypothetical protein [Planktothrix sp. FACHB-1355]
MDELENFAKNAFYLLIGGVALTVERSGQILQEIEQQAPIVIDEMIQVGEAKFNEWSSQQQNYASGPREELRQRLFVLVKGDWELAERLLQQARDNNPGRSEDWYWEKVIYDLERDNL